MLRGHLDNATSLGYIEGWACDTADPTRPVEVGVIWSDIEVAWGLAHRFREDLMGADFGIGWSAFRFLLEVSLDEIRSGPVRLISRSSGAELFSVKQINVVNDGEMPITTLDALSGSDPTVIAGIWQLRKCEQLLTQFISRHGVESFLDTAYSYVLGRRADPNSRKRYARSIRQATLTPVALLEALGNSEEYRASSRALAAPNAPSFPFV